MAEADFEENEYGRRAVGAGWFVLNAQDARWEEVAGRGKWASLESTRLSDQIGVSLCVLEPGGAMARYHWETDEEDFLVVSGEALLIVEGEERPLQQWDFVHCPPETDHVIVGAGNEPCVIFAVGARERHTHRLPDGTLEGKDDWGAYTVDAAALRHGAGVEVETTDASVAYAAYPPGRHVRYGGWLPSPGG